MFNGTLELSLMCVFNYEGGRQPRVLELGLPRLANWVLGSSLALLPDSNKAVGGKTIQLLESEDFVFPQTPYLPHPCLSLTFLVSEIGIHLFKTFNLAAFCILALPLPGRRVLHK